MKLRLALLALLVIPRATTSDRTEFSLRLISFHEHYDAFFRAYFGCPLKAADPSQCNPATGSFDYHEFDEARKAARKLFEQ